MKNAERSSQEKQITFDASKTAIDVIESVMSISGETGISDTVNRIITDYGEQLKIKGLEKMREEIKPGYLCSIEELENEIDLLKERLSVIELNYTELYRVVDLMTILTTKKQLSETF